MTIAQIMDKNNPSGRKWEDVEVEAAMIQYARQECIAFLQDLAEHDEVVVDSSRTAEEMYKIYIDSKTK